MSPENFSLEKKSLRLVQGNPNWSALAESCVAFANAGGGRLRLGIEDDDDAPPPGQKIPAGLLTQVNRRIKERTDNVDISSEIREADNGGKYIEIVVAQSSGVASTTSGRVVRRVGDANRPVPGAELAAFVQEREAERSVSWESAPAKGAGVDAEKLSQLAAALRKIGRMHPSVAAKTDRELLPHYGLVNDGVLTNLGVLCAGDRAARARMDGLGVQFLQFDERGNRVAKWAWEYGRPGGLAVWELPDIAWREVSVFRESYEIPDGMRRRAFAVFPEAVVRELLVNALVHRPYTSGGDIFFNLRPGEMEAVNPGGLPPGVTPEKILEGSKRRNPDLAKLFHDLGLMEKEGSGFDMIYETLLSQGRPAPRLSLESDRVRVLVARRPPDARVLALVEKADRMLGLSQREKIALGFLAQSGEMKITEFASFLGVEDGLENWTGRLLAEGILQTVGRANARRWIIPAEILRTANLSSRVRSLSARILDVLASHPDSRLREIQARMGAEIPQHQIAAALADLRKQGSVRMSGIRKSARYALAPRQ